MPRVIKGESISTAELDRIPEEHRLYWTDALPHIQTLDTLSDIDRDAFMEKIERQMAAVTYECPEGADITDRVVSACAGDADGKVVVECMHNTWARYPCQV